MGIISHTLVKNEENFIWFAINSVIDYMDEMLVWDHGSIDSTVSIIKSIKNPKIKFKQVTGEVSELRQKMIDETDLNWIFILDGDEIWFESSIGSLISNITNDIDCIAVHNYMLIGDMYHYQEEEAGRYNIAGKKGHLNIRAVRNTPGLNVHGDYGNEGYSNKEGVKIQDLPKEKILFLDKPYLHASFLKRSSKSRPKFKYEIGEKFPKDFYYPEVFFKDRPQIIPSPWLPMTPSYTLRSLFETPLKKLKRRLL